jgi:hypothetical protein
MSVDICYVISNGFAARMVLHSQLLPSLRQHGLSVTLVVPHGASCGIRDVAERHGATVEEAPALSARRFYLSAALRRYISEDIHQNPALRSFHLRTLSQRRKDPKNWLMARALYPANRLFARWPWGRRWVERVGARTLANPDLASLLHRLQPRVLVSLIPVAPLESSLLYEAQRAGIRTVGQLLSWDNITTKGRFPVPTDYYISWGPIMTAEIQEFYGASPDRIWECGVAHFDAQSVAAAPAKTRAILQELGLRADRPYLFFGMSSPFFCPYEIEVVEWLAKAVRGGAFGREMQLVVRPHPQNLQGYMADGSWLPRLKALPGPQVAVDYPSLLPGELAWNMDQSDLPRLANLLAGCAVSLNSGSTLCLDAVIHDRPVVLVAFDAGHDLPWWQSVRRVVEYRHIVKMLRLGGIRVARSFEELQRLLSDYLDDPQLDRDGRARVLREECGACDGRAADRIAQALVELAQRDEPWTDRHSVPVAVPGGGRGSAPLTRAPDRSSS